MTGYRDKFLESCKRYQGKTHPVDLVGYKLKGHDLADKFRVKHAKVIGIYDQIEDIDWRILPNEFIIKPRWGCSTKGVFPLVRKDGKYENLFKSILMTKEDVIEHFKADTEHGKSLWVEELLSNPLPYDWKVHTFNGKIGIIEQFKRDEKIKYHKYWTDEWKPIEDMCKKIFTYVINNKLPPPEHGEEILITAKLLSKAIGYPFVRIDLYDIPTKGVFLGEITPHPGRTCEYIDYWENKLGEMWEQAEEELKSGKI